MLIQLYVIAKWVTISDQLKYLPFFFFCLVGISIEYFYKFWQVKASQQLSPVWRLFWLSVDILLTLLLLMNCWPRETLLKKEHSISAWGSELIITFNRIIPNRKDVTRKIPSSMELLTPSKSIYFWISIRKRGQEIQGLTKWR